MVQTYADDMDRRQRKSRAALQSALLVLIASKPYAQITIDDVTEQADVARATFYAHFNDKHSLLREATASLVSELADAVGELGPRSGTYSGEGVLAIFKHADAHRDLYRVILSGEGGATCRTLLVEALEEATTVVFSRMAAASGRPLRAPLHIAIYGIVGAMVLTLEHWLRDDHAIDALGLAGQFVHTQMHGIGWALGYEPEDIDFQPPTP